MTTNSPDIWNEQNPQQLLAVVCGVKSDELLANILRDVMTEKEIREISARLEAARLLSQNTPYVKIAAQTKLSSRTIARISDWMQNGSGGYNELFTYHSHLLPARTD